jgi:DNA-binding transcriptional LysR family regulator
VSNTALREPLEWTFKQSSGHVQTVRFEASIAINMTPAVMKAVSSGAGLSVLPDFLAAAGLSSGELVPVLPDWRLPKGGVYAVYPAARFRPPKVTAFIEMLTAALKG